MARVLLLTPTTTYRAAAFTHAAQKLGIDLVTGTEEKQPLQALQPNHFLTIDIENPSRSIPILQQFIGAHPIDAILGVDETSTLAAATLSKALDHHHNPISAVHAARDKHEMRKQFTQENVPSPLSLLRSLDDKLSQEAERTLYPAILKPLRLSSSQGVLRVNNPGEFLSAAARIEKILEEKGKEILIEEFLSGPEVALEGLLIGGHLHTLALFDKPDPLEGPTFEETIYITPSRFPGNIQSDVQTVVQKGCTALGLTEGPIHAEVRITPKGPHIIEIAARSIGGLCSQTLRFGTGISLEEIILCHAIGAEIPTLSRESHAAGVMMIPIPRRGILEGVSGKEPAQEIPGIEGVSITTPLGTEIIPLPEGSRYLGFLFARGETPEHVERSLRKAHKHLHFEIRTKDSG